MIKFKRIVITGVVASALIALPGYSQGHRAGGSNSNREQSVGSNSRRTESPSNSSGHHRGQGQNDSDYNNGRRPQGGDNDSGVATPGASSSGNRTPNRPPAYLPGYREDHGNKNHGRPGHATGSQGVAPPGSGNYYDNSRNYKHGHYLPPPDRPYRPYCRPVPRPVPPPNYRPYVEAAYINNILGLTFGAAYMVSLDYLYDNGYNVDGYNQNTVYLRNVQQLSYMWADATLGYDSRGRLSNMQFVYSSGYGSTSRYDNIYRDLCRNYGNPVTYRRTPTGYEGVWYGAGAENYVTLEYDASYINGQRRYLTILSYGY